VFPRATLFKVSSITLKSDNQTLSLPQIGNQFGQKNYSAKEQASRTTHREPIFSLKLFSHN
jgi:hypothetical protein